MPRRAKKMFPGFIKRDNPYFFPKVFFTATAEAATSCPKEVVSQILLEVGESNGLCAALRLLFSE